MNNEVVIIPFVCPSFPQLSPGVERYSPSERNMRLWEHTHLYPFGYLSQCCYAVTFGKISLQNQNLT